jgi:hypothetical protein
VIKPLRISDIGVASDVWALTSTVTPLLGPIAAYVELPSGEKSPALAANCKVKVA